MPGPVCVGESAAATVTAPSPTRKPKMSSGARRPATSARTFRSPVRCRPPSNRDDTNEWSAPNANVAASVTHGFARSAAMPSPIQQAARPTSTTTACRSARSLAGVRARGRAARGAPRRRWDSSSWSLPFTFLIGKLSGSLCRRAREGANLQGLLRLLVDIPAAAERGLISVKLPDDHGPCALVGDEFRAARQSHTLEMTGRCVVRRRGRDERAASAI
jgi:hypothetical protein